MTEQDFHIDTPGWQTFQALMQLVASADTDDLLELATLLDLNVQTDLIGLDLQQANLCQANLSEINLSDTNLSGANLSQANLSGANLTRANLTQADLSGVNLSQANLSDATLTQADLTQANLNWAIFSRANLSQANLSDADLSQADLSQANLSQANLSQADLSQADLDETDFSRANLSRADLSQLDLNATNFSEANFDTTNLAGTDLNGAILNQARFLNSIGLSERAKKALKAREVIFIENTKPESVANTEIKQVVAQQDEMGIEVGSSSNLSIATLSDSTNLPLLDVLDLALSEILGKSNSYAYSTLATVRRHLYQFRLMHLFEPYEILFEAYLRAKTRQRQGETIYNPHAWLKRTAFNIVREKSRQAQRQSSRTYEDIEYRISAEPEDVIEKIELGNEIELLYKALRALSREDDHTAQLLVWRTIERLSWEQITTRLIELGETEIPTQATLRKRVSRAKKRMRHIMQSYGLPSK